MAVSDMLKITDDYEAFCINEAADYIYYALKNNLKPPESGNSLLKRLAKRKYKWLLVHSALSGLR